MLGVALVLVGGGVVVLTTPWQTPPTGQVVAGDFPVNAGATDLTDIRAHNSPTLLANPVDAANLVVVNRVDTPRFSCGMHVSVDGGSTWVERKIPIPKGQEPKCYAPDAAFDADGVLYVSYVTLKGNGNVPEAAWVVSSTDGGDTVGEPERVLGRYAFQVRLRADPQVAGRLYLTWLQAEQVAPLALPDTGNPIMARRSDDGGASWSAPVEVSGERDRVVAPTPALGPDGAWYVLYLDLGDDRLDYHGGHEGRGGPAYPGVWSLVLGRSTDAGRSWSETTVDDQVVPAERFIVFIPPFPALAVDQASGRVYAAFADARAGDADVWVWASPDGGARWGEPVRVNDTPAGDAATQTRPQLAVAPHGRVDVVYYDRRADPDDVMTEVSLQSSSDGAATFTPRVVLSDRAFDSGIGFGSERGLADLGSRLALLATDTHALAVWADTRAGTEGSGKQDLTRALVAFPPPAPLSPAAATRLRLAGVAVGVAGLFVLLHALAAARPRRRDGAE